MNNTNDWYALPEEPVEWLVDGLITTDDCAAANGKPKSGKSTGIRNLIAAVILGSKFLNRDVCVPPGTGRVLYVHLDRKDRPHRVAKELRQLGITREESSRVRLLTEKGMPKDSGFDARCQWLADEVTAFKPNLVVIDLLLHFVRTKKGVNDYDTMIDAIAQLQDALSECGYRGAMLVSLHARKASGEDVGDSVLGSTGIRGSLSTLLHFHHYRKEKSYTVQSDQSVRSDTFGELDETIVNRDAVTGVVSLGAKYEDVKVQDKKDEWTLRRSTILSFVKKNSSKTADEIATALNMSKKTVLPILEELKKSSDIRSSGEGVKGDPQLYFGDVLLKAEPPELPLVEYICCDYGDCTTQVATKGEFCNRHKAERMEVTCVN
jgi:AAA domain